MFNVKVHLWTASKLDAESDILIDGCSNLVSYLRTFYGFWGLRKEQEGRREDEQDGYENSLKHRNVGWCDDFENVQGKSSCYKEEENQICNLVSYS